MLHTSGRKYLRSSSVSSSQFCFSLFCKEREHLNNVLHRSPTSALERHETDSLFFYTLISSFIGCINEAAVVYNREHASCRCLHDRLTMAKTMSVHRNPRHSSRVQFDCYSLEDWGMIPDSSSSAPIILTTSSCCYFCRSSNGVECPRLQEWLQESFL